MSLLIGGNRLCPGNYSMAVENWLDFHAEETPYWKTTQRCTDAVHYVRGPGALFTVVQYAGRMEVRFAEGVRVEGVDVYGVDGTPVGAERFFVPDVAGLVAFDTRQWDRGVYILRAKTSKGVMLSKMVVGE